ncbi:hypothetical protein [Gemmata sp.]|uniref:hypothetical protein n=1 Tax=Gemmata sp. TaxID=1914242 RepID=UPI003F6ED2C9
MPSNPRKNKGVYMELPPDLVEQVKALAERRGHTFKDEVIEGLRRHVAYPPPPPAPVELLPLPPVTTAVKPAVTKKGKGTGRG